MRLQLMNELSKIIETRRADHAVVCNFSDVLFDFDAVTLSAGGREKINKLASILNRQPGSYHVEIAGHSDALGSDDYNLKLSQERAEAVRQALEQAGIDSSRIHAARGVGRASPVASNDTPEGRQLNRRVEVIITDASTQ